MKKVLFIAYYFPPMGGSGVQRSTKFTKYLRNFKYNPVVLTVNSSYTRWVKDKSSLKDIPDDTIIYRTPTIDFNWLFKVLWGLRLSKVVGWLLRNVLIPDAETTWLPFAKFRLSQIIKKHKIDIAYISGGPFSSMLLGPYLLKKYNIKYIVDFRDEWTNSLFRLDGKYPKHSVKKDNKLEKHVLNDCSGIVYAVPHYMRANFESKYPFLKAKKFREITNGFDEEDFSNGKLITTPNNSRLNIVYTGTFYDRTKPWILWEALQRLYKANMIDTSMISIDIVGKNSVSFVMGKYIKDKEIMNMVRFTSHVGHSEVIRYIEMADTLLIYISPGANCKALLTGKIFDYMRSYKPIFAIVPPDGAASELIRQSSTGFVCDTNDVEDVKNVFLEVYSKWQNKQLINTPDKEYIAKFGRKYLTSKLVSLFDEVLSDLNENR